jgi:hypothetical protein
LFVVMSSTLAYISILCWTGPTPQNEERTALQTISIVCMIVWTAEAALKLGGYGAWAYLRDPWDMLDLITTISLYIDVIGLPGTSFAYMRMLRFTQPLRRWRCFHLAHHMLESILRSFAHLPPVATLIFIFLLLMALVGRNIFGSSGSLRNRCVWPETGILVIPETHCANASWGIPYTCAAPQVCMLFADREPLNSGVVSFDNAGGAVIAAALVMLQEDFSNMIFATVDSTGQVRW